MKKQFGLFALCVIFGAGLAPAGPLPQEVPAAQTGHRADPSQQLRRLTKKLNLTSEQQSQLLPILTDRQQQMAALRNDSSLSAQDRHAKAKALREDSDFKIKAVLNDNQKQQYQQLQQHRRQHENNS
jgi:protein CpxP